MRRKVEGLTLDLTVDPPLIIDERVSPRRRRVKQSKQAEKKQTVPTHVCATCGGITTPPLCYMCKCLSLATPETALFIREAYKGPCSLCGEVKSKYHYDHLNMFDKTATILDLIDQPIGRIAEEIAKCHLVCIPCHEMITAKEVSLGYMAKKKALNRAARAGEDITERRIALATAYAADFSAIYAGLANGRF